MMKQTLNIGELEICNTDDQSKTVLHKSLDAHYRSTYGALAESEWVFFNGCRLSEKKQWNVIELGFGLGTNVQTLLNKREDERQNLFYIGLDHQPIPSTIIDQLYPPSSLMNEIMTSLFSQIESGASIAEWSQQNLHIELWAQDIRDADLPNNWANAFFHDPFGPSTNPESWTPEVFALIAASLSSDGILSTYGAAGHARRSMVQAGLWTASTTGYGRKREMTVASSSQEQLSHAQIIQKYVPKQSL